MIIPAKTENDTKQPDRSAIPEERREDVESIRYRPEEGDYEVTFTTASEMAQVKKRQQEVESRLDEVKMPGGGPMKKLEEAIADLDQRISALE